MYGTILVIYFFKSNYYFHHVNASYYGVAKHDLIKSPLVYACINHFNE